MAKSLTKYQQELVENNHNLIYKFAHKNKLSVEEYYGLLAIGLCKAAEVYDENKNTFSTLAYVCMTNVLNNYWKHIQTSGVIPNERIVSYDANNMLNGESYNDGFLNCLTDNNSTDDIVINNIMLESFYNMLTKREKIVIELLVNSVPQVQIAERMGCTKQNIGYCISQIRKKFGKYSETC